MVDRPSIGMTAGQYHQTLNEGERHNERRTASLPTMDSSLMLPYVFDEMSNTILRIFGYAYCNGWLAGIARFTGDVP